MFRARFAEAFPKSLANFGPHELERDVSEPIPGERVEHFLCALLSLLLNRKQDVKYVPSVETDKRRSTPPLLTMLACVQAWSLQPCARGSHTDSQGPMGQGLGEQEPACRRGYFHYDDAGSTCMSFSKRSPRSFSEFPRRE